MPSLPLTGYRILDFCWLIAGPLTTRILADLGAEVIKVESISRVDRIRETGVQPPGLLSPNTNGVFNDCNTNKKSVTINLSEPEGIQVIKDLVCCSDVVSSNFTPDRMDRWGLGYDDLRRVRPDIIAINMPVMGTSGPKRDWSSYGNGIIAMAGLANLSGFPERPPVGLGTLHSDFTTPYFSALQIMAALHERENTGEGQFLEMAQYEAAVHLLDTELVQFLVNGEEPARRGNHSADYSPHGVYRCRGEERWLAIAVRDTSDWLQLCAAIGAGALAGRPEFHQVDGRRAAEAVIDQVIADWAADQDVWVATELLQARGVPASPVEDVADLVEHDRGMRDHFMTFHHPEGVDILVQQEPLTWNAERLPLTRAPLMGEHTEEVFRELLGHSSERYIEFMVSKVIY